MCWTQEGGGFGTVNRRYLHHCSCSCSCSHCCYCWCSMCHKNSQVRSTHFFSSESQVVLHDMSDLSSNAYVYETEFWCGASSTFTLRSHSHGHLETHFEAIGTMLSLQLRSCPSWRFSPYDGLGKSLSPWQVFDIADGNMNCWCFLTLVSGVADTISKEDSTRRSPSVPFSAVWA